MITLHFYTTAGCHLCEQALALLEPLVASGRVRVVSRDIADDDELMRRYGVRIPVLRVDGTARELGWPFDAHALCAYIADT